MLTEYNIEADKSFIGAWFIADIDLCDRLIDYFESSKDKAPGVMTTGVGRPAVIPSIKDSIDLILDPSESIVLEYSHQLQLVTNEYIKLYERSNITGPWKVEAANIQKYNPGMAYHMWHTERGRASLPIAFRHLAFMTYLNDVTDAGETEFLYQKVKVKPKKGLTLIWPTDWTHTHRGIPSLTNTKYILTGWYGFYQI
jgi:hypothetical protein